MTSPNIEWAVAEPHKSIEQMKNKCRIGYRVVFVTTESGTAARWMDDVEVEPAP